MRLGFSVIGRLCEVIGQCNKSRLLTRHSVLTQLSCKWYSHRIAEVLSSHATEARRKVEVLAEDTPYDSGNMSVNNKTFKEAVLTLNSLQSNAAEIEARRLINKKPTDKLALMVRSLQQLGISLEDINKLNVIHITGTKGKGSTAALTESILRHHGYKTGFYSSPHLVEVRERIRLEGSPIPQEMFGDYFWQVYDSLRSQLAEGEQLPFYFKFLTLMAFKVFISEGVNAAIIEVGIGGRFDCTNVIPKPVVCGITSLGIDHTSVLGGTIEEISWQKAGIIKSGCPTITVPQPASALEVLWKCGEEVGSPVFQAPAFDARQQVTDIVPSLGLSGDVQLRNASLAVQLSRVFMDRYQDRQRWTTPTYGACTLPLVNLSTTYTTGLKNCRWPGRFHKTSRENITYYLDGAHTVESITEAFSWFRQQSVRERQELESAGRTVRTVFMFNRTGTRSAKDLMQPMTAQRSEFKFDMALFCPIMISSEDHSDCNDRRIVPGAQLSEIQSHKNAWLQLLHFDHPDQSADQSAGQPVVHLFPSLKSAICWLNRDTQGDCHLTTASLIPKDVYLQVFVTGSLYLVGNSFYFLKEPL